MSISYDLFLKHAHRITKSDARAFENHPVLKGVKHFEDGSAAVTDAHRLYIAKNIHDRADGAVVTHTGKKLEGNYPNVERLIPWSDPQREITVNVQDLLHAADIAHTIGRLDGDVPAVLFSELGRIIYSSPEITFAYQFLEEFNFRIRLNALYLLDAIKMFKDAGCQEVTIKFYGSVRPLLIENEDLLSLILPIRMD